MTPLIQSVLYREFLKYKHCLESQPHRAVYKSTSELGTLSIQGSQLGPSGVLYREFYCIQDSQLGPSGVLYREVPLYTGQPAGSQWCPLM